MEDEVAKILILGERPSAREFLAEELAGEGHLVVAIGSSALIRELLTTLAPDLVLLDFLRGKIDLWGALEEIKRRDPHPPVFTFTSYGLYKEEIRFEVTNEYEIEAFSLEILKQKVADLLRRKTIQQPERTDHDFLLPRTKILSREAID